MKYRVTSDTNIIVEELDNSKRFLHNTNVYQQFIDIHNREIFSKLHETLGLSYTIYTIGVETLQLYSSIEKEDFELIKKIINTSSIDYTFCLPSNLKYLPSHIQSTTINICVTSDKALSNILYKTGDSLIAFNANIKNDIYYTNQQDVFNEYIDTDILIFKNINENNPKGLENSILSINNQKIEILYKAYYDDIFIKSNIVDLSPTDCGNYEDMKFHLVNIMDIPLDEKMKPEYRDIIIKQFQNKYINHSAFIDFNQSMSNYKNMFSIYVDSSCNGDYEEAIFNMYSIIYQIMKSGCTKILINNIDYIRKDNNIFENILFDRYKILSSSTIMLPFMIFMK